MAHAANMSPSSGGGQHFLMVPAALPLLPDSPHSTSPGTNPTNTLWPCPGGLTCHYLTSHGPFESQSGLKEYRDLSGLWSWGWFYWPCDISWHQQQALPPPPQKSLIRKIYRFLENTKWHHLLSSPSTFTPCHTVIVAEAKVSEADLFCRTSQTGSTPLACIHQNFPHCVYVCDRESLLLPPLSIQLLAPGDGGIYNEPQTLMPPGCRNIFSFI